MAGTPRRSSRSSGEDQLFDFDDQPHRFDVIDGGRAEPRAPRSAAPAAPSPPRRPVRKPARKQGTFMQRMEQRWERRRHEGY